MKRALCIILCLFLYGISFKASAQLADRSRADLKNKKLVFPPYCTMLKNQFTLILIACILTLSAAWGQESRPSYNTTTGFFVKNGVLYDANGYQFVPRGVNNGHVWHDKEPNSGSAYGSLDNIAGFGFNSVRIVWGIHQWVNADGSFGPLSNDNILRSVLDRCIELDMIPMVELLDYTGGTSSSDVSTAARWWAERANLVNDYEQYIIVNILNEWGQRNSVSDTQFRDAYKSAITTIRNAGIKATLLIDGNQWAQELSPIKNYGAEMVNHDPLKNVGFGVHYYCEVGIDAGQIESELDWAKNNGILMMVGEFAHQHADYGRGGVCDIQEATVTRVCQENNQGYYWWAWISSGDREINFSLADTWEASTRAELTDIGEWLVYQDANGIQNTARKATVFTNAPPTNPEPPTPPTTGNVTVRARGTSGTEQLEIRYKDQKVGNTITLSTTFQEYKVQVDNPAGNFKVAFINDNATRDAVVDWLQVGTVKRQAENRSTNTAVYQNGSCGGSNSQTMNCNGYIDFGSFGSTTSGKVVIRARGTCGSETMVLQVAGTDVKTWTNLSTSFTDYTYDSYSGSKNVKVRFTNDGTTSSGCDKNLVVDKITVCGTAYQAESVTRNGCGAGEWLYCNGNFDFGSVGCSASVASGNSKLAGDELVSTTTHEQFKVYPNPASQQLTVQGSEDYQVTLYDMSGRKVMQHKHLTGAASLDVKGIKPGLYLIKISDANQQQISQRVIIE